MNSVTFDNVLLAEETKVDDNTRIGLWPDISIGKCITMNLNMPGVFLGVRNGDLGLRIPKGNR